MTARRLQSELPPVGLAAAAALAVGVTAALALPGLDEDAFVPVVAVLAGAACALLAWTVPPSVTLSAGILLLPFSGNWDQLGLPGAVAPDRALLLLGCAAAFARAGARRPRLGPEHVLLAAAALWAVGSALAAGTIGSGAFRLLDRFGLMAFAVAAAAPIAFREERDRRTLLVALTALGAYLGATALLELAGPRALVLPGYIVDAGYGIHFGRARGPFVEAATNGFALFACGAAALVLARRVDGVRRVLVLGVVALCALGVVLTLQRTIWVGASLAVVLTLLSRRALWPTLLPAALAAALLVGAAFVAVPGFAERAAERRAATDSVYDRINLDAAATAMVEARPLTGFGWDRFTQASGPYFWQGDVPLTAGDVIAHNAVLANASELGLPGALLWVAALAACVGAALRARWEPALLPWRDALVALSALALVVALLTPMLQPWPLVLLLAWAGALRGAAG